LKKCKNKPGMGKDNESKQKKNQKIYKNADLKSTKCINVLLLKEKIKSEPKLEKVETYCNLQIPEIESLLPKDFSLQG